MPGPLKIGFTNRDVRERVAELSAATGVPKPFEIEYYCLARDVEDIEGKVDQQLSAHRSSGKEFFKVALIDAVYLIDSLVRKVEPDRFCNVTAMPLGPDDKICRHCGTINRDVRSVGLDRDKICKKCGMLFGWGES